MTNEAEAEQQKALTAYTDGLFRIFAAGALALDHSAQFGDVLAALRAYTGVLVPVTEQLLQVFEAERRRVPGPEPAAGEDTQTAPIEDNHGLDSRLKVLGERYQRAPLSRRWLASMIDNIACVLLAWGVITWLLLVRQPVPSAPFDSSLVKELMATEAGATVFGYLIAAVYFTFCWGLAGSSVGKYVLGVAILGPDGRRLSGLAGVLRASLRFLLYLMIGWTFGVPLVRKDRRALHDLAAGTRVVLARDLLLHERGPSMRQDSLPIPISPLPRSKKRLSWVAFFADGPFWLWGILLAVVVIKALGENLHHFFGS